MKKIQKKQFNLIFSSILCLILFFTPKSAKAAHFEGVTATPTMVDFIGYITVNGTGLDAGNEAGVYDDQNLLVGAIEITTKGQYGVLHVYGDDSQTPIHDGANTDSLLTFKIWLSNLQKEIIVTEDMMSAQTLGSFEPSPIPPRWTADRNKYVLNITIPDDCPDDPNKIEPGICGCGVSDKDTDGDGVADCIDRPDPPTLNNPISGGIVTSLKPTLSVNNATDSENDTLLYEFELYSDKDISDNVAASSSVAEGYLITSWEMKTELIDNSVYYWRARAREIGNDGDLVSSWMPTALFKVNTEGEETVLEINASKNVSADISTIQVVEVDDTNSTIYGISIEIPPNALLYDYTITIGIVRNPPALPPNVKAIGSVIHFGPSGIEFKEPITIKIPYTEDDLKAAGVTNPIQLEVFTYDIATLSWKEISLEEVDEAGKFLIFKAGYFSMYAKGIYFSEPEGDGGGACFINSLIFKTLVI